MTMLLLRASLAAQGLKVQHLEANQDEQDAFLSVFHAYMHTFNITAAVKIIENHLGKAFLKLRAVQGPSMIPGAAPGQPQPPPAHGGPAAIEN